MGWWSQRTARQKKWMIIGAIIIVIVIVASAAGAGGTGNESRGSADTREAHSTTAPPQVTSTSAAPTTTTPQVTSTSAAPTTAPARSTTTDGLAVSITEFTSPVSPNSQVTLRAKTQPGADCRIAVFYSSGPSEADGLESKKANSNGSVSWTWKVGPKTSPGEYRVVVTANFESKSGREETKLVVKP